MTVIINELEVTTQPGDRAEPTTPPSGQTTPPPAPFELRATLRHMALRTERLRAD